MDKYILDIIKSNYPGYVYKNGNHYCGNNVHVSVPGVTELGNGIGISNMYVAGCLTFPDLKALHPGALNHISTLGQTMFPKLETIDAYSIKNSVLVSGVHANAITNIEPNSFERTIMGSCFWAGKQWQPTKLSDKEFKPYFSGVCILGNIKIDSCIRNTAEYTPKAFGAKQLKDLNLKKRHELIYWIALYKNITKIGWIDVQSTMNILNYNDKMTLDEFLVYMEQKEFREFSMELFNQGLAKQLGSK